MNSILSNWHKPAQISNYVSYLKRANQLQDFIKRTLTSTCTQLSSHLYILFCTEANHKKGKRIVRKVPKLLLPDLARSLPQNVFWLIYKSLLEFQAQSSKIFLI